MDLADHQAGVFESKPIPAANFSHGKDRFCFSRYVSGLHADRNCINCPHLYECRRALPASASK